MALARAASPASRPGKYFQPMTSCPPPGACPPLRCARMHARGPQQLRLTLPRQCARTSVVRATVRRQGAHAIKRLPTEVRTAPGRAASMHANVRASRAEQRLFDGGTASPLASRKASRQHACMHDPGEGNACVTRGRKTCTTGEENACMAREDMHARPGEGMHA